jgi:hypothetical protein
MTPNPKTHFAPLAEDLGKSLAICIAIEQIAKGLAR